MLFYYLKDHLWRIISTIICITMCNATSVHAQGEGQIVNNLAWNSDGTRLAIGYTDGTLQIVDTFNDQVLNSYQLAQEGFQAIYGVAWNPTGANVLAVSGGNSGNRQAAALVLDVGSGSEIFTFGDAQDISSIAWDPDGTRLAISIDYIADNLGNRNVQIWDIASNRLVLRIAVGSHSITSLAWNSEGNRLAGTSTDSNVIIWDATNGQPILTLAGHVAATTDVVWNPDDTLLVTSSEVTDSTIRVWDAITGVNLLTIPNIYTSELAWSSDGAQLAVLNTAKSVDVFDPSSGQMLAQYVDGALASSIAYSPYGGRLAFGGQVNVNATERSNPNQSTRTLAGGAVRIVVPAPSLERLQAIADACSAPAAVEQSLTADIQAGQLTDFVARVEALPEGTIPPACAADLIAVAEALENR